MRARTGLGSVRGGRGISTPGATSGHHPRLSLHAADGTLTRIVEANDETPLDRYRLGTPELLEVPNRDGFVMSALMITPPDFDPTRRYPVYQHVYGGPHAQRVRRRLGRLDISVLAAAGPARRDRLGARQPHGQRAGSGLDLARLPAVRGARAARPRGRYRLALAAAVCGQRSGSASRDGATAGSW